MSSNSCSDPQSVDFKGLPACKRASFSFSFSLSKRLSSLERRARRAILSPSLRSSKLLLPRISSQDYKTPLSTCPCNHMTSYNPHHPSSPLANCVDGKMEKWPAIILWPIKTVTGWQQRHKLWAGVVIACFAPPHSPNHSPPPSSRWLRAEWRAAVGSDAVDASGQSVTAEHSGLHSLLSHPVTVSGRCKAEMSLNCSEYHQRNNKTTPSFLDFVCLRWCMKSRKKYIRGFFCLPFQLKYISTPHKTCFYLAIRW